MIVENPENKDSVLDIRLPVFKDGQLQSIVSYMEHFPFQHYIVLRSLNLPNSFPAQPSPISLKRFCNNSR